MDNNKIYPLTKFYIAIAFSIAPIIMPNLIGKAIIFICINIMAIMFKKWFEFIKRLSSSVFILFAILMFIQTFFYPKGEIIFSFLGLNAKKEGFYFGLNLGLNIICVGGSLIWFFITTPVRDFVLSLEKAGMSYKASYVVLSTLQMVSVLKKKSQIIMNAQKSRGVETEGNFFTRAKVFIPIIIPLVLGSISSIEERAQTLEARGFSSKTQRTYLYDIKKNKLDKILNICVFVFLIILLIWRFLIWNA